MCKGLINFAFIWRSLKGRCHGNQFKTKNWRFWQNDLHCHAAIPKRIGISEWRLASEKSIECGYIMYKFGEVQFSNSTVPFAHFCTCMKKNWQKSVYLADYLRTCSTDPDHVFSFDVVGMINLNSF